MLLSILMVLAPLVAEADDIPCFAQQMVFQSILLVLDQISSL